MPGMTAEELRGLGYRSVKTDLSVDPARVEAARRAIEEFIEARWKDKTLANWEGYDFDGRLLRYFDRDFWMLVTFDQWGTLWVNGLMLGDQPGENNRVDMEALFKAERDARRNWDMIREAGNA